MGIKGIYKEIGAGTRISFCRLGVDSLETRDRPLRLAIDISIWQFQVQAARGGANPAIRTLFYRLVRLLGLPIHPVFVFDGPNKPVFKRNKRSGTGDGMATAMAKRLIRLFGFVVHDAPGEAEAECALLQQRGVVDAVLSEDVDTLMFGCTRSLRNWSAAKGATSPPTHVSMYEAVPATPAAPPSHAGLDREGMVLVALMSGGDYHPEGVPGCGVKLACEAAKAGFGRSLCRLKRSDTAALAAWRDQLTHELRTNESRFFRTCHHKLHIPDTFPSIEVLRYYTHPVVSPPEVIERVRADLVARETAGRPADLDLVGLRAFVAETFDWTNRDGAIKFIRVLAPSLLARILLLRWSADGGDGAAMPPWPAVVEGISKQRAHASTDETPELRVAFVPVTVVGLDLDAEPDAPAANFGRDGLALNSDDEFDEPAPTQAELGDEAATAGTSKAAPYDPTQTDVAWVPRAMVEMGAPQALEAWEAKQRKKGGTRKTTAKGKEKAAPASSAGSESTRGRRKPRTPADAGMQAGALDRYMQVTKNVGDGDASKTVEKTVKKAAEKTTSRRKPREAEKTKATDPPDLQVLSSDDDVFGRLPSNKDNDTAKTPSTSKPQPQTPHKAKAKARLRNQKGANPWALSGSQAAPRATKPGGNSSRMQKTATAKPPPRAPIEVVDLLSSPAEPKTADSPAKTPTKTPSRRRTQTTAASQPGTPRQTSIKDFLTQPAAVLDTEDEDEDEDEDENDMVKVSRDRHSAPVFSSPVQTRESSTRTKTVYVPRRSAVGYFREEIVDEDEVNARAAPPGRPRRGWRESEVGVVDLTGLGSDYEIV